MDLNKVHYVVATAIIIKDGNFLIAKRSDNEKVNPGQWTVPGGKLEVSDYSKRPKDTSMHWYNIFETVVKREVKEEVGLDIKNLKYLTSLSFIRPDGIPTIVASFFADYKNGNVKLCKDLTEFAWVNLKEARKYELIEGIYEELEMLDNLLKGKNTEEWKK